MRASPRDFLKNHYNSRKFSRILNTDHTTATAAGETMTATFQAAQNTPISVK